MRTKAYVFEGHLSITWVTNPSMRNNFHTGIWKRGGMTGSTPQDALGVLGGLGETMRPEVGRVAIPSVTVLVAVTRRGAKR